MGDFPVVGLRLGSVLFDCMAISLLSDMVSFLAWGGVWGVVLRDTMLYTPSLPFFDGDG